MALNIVKLAVGIRNVEHLKQKQKTRIEQEGVLVYTTRNTPVRSTEILNGGSIFWVFKGLILARQKILGFDKYIGEDNVLRCKIILDSEIMVTEPHQKKPFQGWRYLKQKDAPKDREIFSDIKTQLPLQIEKELSLIGIL